MRRRSAARTVARTVAPLVVAAAALSACGSGPTLTARPAADVPHAVVVPRQAERVLDAVDTAVSTATARREAPALTPRVVGPARDQLAAGIAVQRALKAPGAAAPDVGRSRLLLPRAGGWPRWFVAAGQAQGQPTPVVRVLLSPSARAPYALWAQMALLPGAALPEVADPAGAQVLRPAAPAGLVRSPQDVVAAYARVLTAARAGAGGADADLFTPDAFRSELATQLAADRRALGARDVAEVTSVHRPADSGVLALRTADGGALVVAALQQQYVVTVGRGKGSVTLDRPTAALFGKDTVARQLRRTSVETLAFSVPPAGNPGKVRLIAASKADIRATGS